MHHNNEKNREYKERITRYDGGTFTPLVCSVFAGLSTDVKDTIARAVAIRAEARGPGWEDRVSREILVETMRIQIAILRVVGDALGSRPRGIDFRDRPNLADDQQHDDDDDPPTAGDDTLVVSSFMLTEDC